MSKEELLKEALEFGKLIDAFEETVIDMEGLEKMTVDLGEVMMPTLIERSKVAIAEWLPKFEVFEKSHSPISMMASMMCTYIRGIQKRIEREEQKRNPK